MNIMKNCLARRSLLLLVFFYSGKVLACPCFNEGFVKAVFSHQEGIQCTVYEKEGITYKIDINDSLHNYRAVSTPVSCSLNSPYHNIFMNYNDTHGEYANYIDYYHKEQLNCITQILEACTRLNVITRVKPEF